MGVLIQSMYPKGEYVLQTFLAPLLAIPDGSRSVPAQWHSGYQWRDPGASIYHSIGGAPASFI
jgi:hypothetical protein